MKCTHRSTNKQGKNGLYGIYQSLTNLQNFYFQWQGEITYLPWVRNKSLSSIQWTGMKSIGEFHLNDDAKLTISPELESKGFRLINKEKWKGCPLHSKIGIICSKNGHQKKENKELSVFTWSSKNLPPIHRKTIIFCLFTVSKQKLGLQKILKHADSTQRNNCAT